MASLGWKARRRPSSSKSHHWPHPNSLIRQARKEHGSFQRQQCARTLDNPLPHSQSVWLEPVQVQVPKRSPSDLPPEARERHCPVMGLYSWVSSAHTQRNDPSTFSQKASPHTPLSSSHSFTSAKGNTDEVRCVPPSWQLFHQLYQG